MKKKKVKTIKIIAKKNLKQFLLKNNIYDMFINNKIRCEICNEVVNFENIGAFKVKDKNLIFICNNTLCLKEVNNE
ncbi:MAG: hypothetical protein P9L89_02055 [Candidatus Celaenobacter polaris]|nr:hypothetical protein [Candidatus Celaenobacter polaris]